MKLVELADLPEIAAPWTEGDNIPWNDPDFSQRMLKEHLRQDHDAASRRFEKIDAHVAWIHRQLLKGRSTRILDLCCGPGLYTNRLAKLGHTCVGIDYSPASITYARDVASKEKLNCTYRHEDIRTAAYGGGFGLVMLIYGEFNVFRPSHARTVLEKVHGVLNDDGLVLLEPQTLAAIQKRGEKRSSWYFAKQGLFSDQPHLCLEQRFWDARSATTTTRFLIIDVATGETTRYALTAQAYTRVQYDALLTECGFEVVKFLPSLTGAADESQSDMMVIVARKSELDRDTGNDF